MKKNRPVDKLYKTIANAQKKIDAIRKKCKHKKTRVGLYSWRIGALDSAELCNACDAVVKMPSMVSLQQATPMTFNNDGTVTFGLNPNEELK